MRLCKVFFLLTYLGAGIYDLLNLYTRFAESGYMSVYSGVVGINDCALARHDGVACDIARDCRT